MSHVVESEFDNFDKNFDLIYNKIFINLFSGEYRNHHRMSQPCWSVLRVWLRRSAVDPMARKYYVSNIVS
jgi:hypothetical protein